MVEHRSPKPRVVGSSPSAPAKLFACFSVVPEKMVLEMFIASIYTKKKEIKVTSIFKFIQQSRQEASKIVWPTRRETITTTVMVFVMVSILATFFLIIDSVISFLLRIVLSLSF